MGDALLLIRNKDIIKKTFTDIKLTEANSTGYSDAATNIT